VGKAAALQEARTARALLTRRGGLSVLASQDLARTLDFRAARLGYHGLGNTFGDALGTQIVDDACRAVLARELVSTRFRVALVGELLSLRELVEQLLECRARLGVPRELARELRARVLAAREQPERPRLQLRRGIGDLGTVSPACALPQEQAPLRLPRWPPE